MCAVKHIVLPDGDAVEFAHLQTALFEELAPVGALQMVLARRVAVAAWRLARADRMEAELFEQRRWDNGGVGIALIRDGNGTRSFETLMRYRSAAMAEFMRALRTLKALQAGQGTSIEPDPALARRSTGGIARMPLSTQPIRFDPGPKEPEPRRSGREGTGWAPADGPEPSLALHEPPAPWVPNEPELRETVHEAGARRTPTGPGGHSRGIPNEPEAALGISARAKP
jgi:hypothetical protein